ncbi:MAG: DUF1566 domain-containing protein [Betaproteobacteria bacterium]|nr:MAG: DUF1566 domain-containing protein [Betaproteobacteria bacterium]
MNAPAETVALKIGDGTLIVPAEGLARAWLDRELGTPLQAQLETTARRALPTIGAAFEGGQYAGPTVHDNDPRELVLLPGEFKGSWQDARAWANQQGGELPTRFDALVLFQNLKSAFKPEWYWTANEVAGDAVSAWIQTFDHGGQSLTHKSHAYRARAVRRVSI